MEQKTRLLLMREVECLANYLIVKNLKNIWTFRWSTARTKIGECAYNVTTPAKSNISISRSYVMEVPRDLMLDVTFHEVAHAVQFEETGYSSQEHDDEWLSIYQRLGGDHEVGKMEVPTLHKVSYSCECGYTWLALRKTRNVLVCPECDKRGVRSFLSETSLAQAATGGNSFDVISESMRIFVPT